MICTTLDPYFKLLRKSSEISSFLAEPIGKLAFICMLYWKFVIKEDPILGAFTLYGRRDTVELEILGLEFHLAWAYHVAKYLISKDESGLGFAFTETALIVPFTSPFGLKPTWGFMGHAVLYFWGGFVFCSESEGLMVRLWNFLPNHSWWDIISFLSIFTKTDINFLHFI